MFNRSTYGFSRNRIYKWPAVWIQPSPAEESGAGHQTLENPEGLGCLEDQILPSSFPLDHVVRIPSRKTNIELQQWCIFLTDFPDVKLEGSYPTRRRAAWKASLGLAGGWSAG